MARVLGVKYDPKSSDSQLQLDLLDHIIYTIHSPSIAAWNITARWGLLFVLAWLIYSLATKFKDNEVLSSLGIASILDKTRILTMTGVSLFGINLMYGFLNKLRHSRNIRSALARMKNLSLSREVEKTTMRRGPFPPTPTLSRDHTTPSGRRSRSRSPSPSSSPTPSSSIRRSSRRRSSMSHASRSARRSSLTRRRSRRR